MALDQFHVTLHARPANVRSAGVRRAANREIEVLDVPSGELGPGFDRTFEEVAESLGRFERLFFEPDGSFVWVASADEPRWQLDGVVFDRNGRVLYVDLKGTCPAERLDQLLTALGWPAAPVMFQSVREAVFLDEATFRVFCLAATGLTSSTSPHAAK